MTTFVSEQNLYISEYEEDRLCTFMGAKKI